MCVQVVTNHLNIHKKKKKEKREKKRKKKMSTRLNDADAVSNTLSHDVLSTAVVVYTSNRDTSEKKKSKGFCPHMGHRFT